MGIITTLYCPRGTPFWVSGCDKDRILAMGRISRSGDRLTITRPDGKCIPIGPAILDPPSGMVVDHIDGNGLNNTRQNLRICTHSQNGMNKTRPFSLNPKKSKYKGVYANAPHTKWRTMITHEGRVLRSEWLDSEEDAARIYDRICLELRGQFAWLNFPFPGRPQNGSPLPGPWNL